MARTKTRAPLRTQGGAWGQRRVDLGLSIRELERRSGVSRGVLSLAEGGRLVPRATEYDSVMDVLREQEEAHKQGG